MYSIYFSFSSKLLQLCLQLSNLAVVLNHNSLELDAFLLHIVVWITSCELETCKLKIHLFCSLPLVIQLLLETACIQLHQVNLLVELGLR